MTSSTTSGESTAAMLDGDKNTRWSSGHEQTTGQWIQLDMGSEQSVDQIVMDSGSNRDDYAHGYEVYVSNDGKNWGSTVASGEGKNSFVTAAFPLQTVRYLKVVQTAGQWIQLDLGSLQNFRELTLNSGNSENDYGRGYQVLVSKDGVNWSLIAENEAASKSIVERFTLQTARYVKIIQTKEAPAWWWSVSELNLYK